MHLQPAHVQQALPAGWECALDAATGHWYYFNRATGATSWVPPQAPTYPTPAAEGPETAGPHAAPGSGATGPPTAPGGPAASGGALAPAALGTQAAGSLPSQPAPYTAATTTAAAAAASTAAVAGAAPSAAAVVAAGALQGVTGVVASGAAERSTAAAAPAAGALRTTGASGSSSGWYYRDRAGQLQGPFQQHHLHAWRSFLPMDLLVWYVELATTRGQQQPQVLQPPQQQQQQQRAQGQAQQGQGGKEPAGSVSPGRSEATPRSGKVGAAEAEQGQQQEQQQEQRRAASQERAEEGISDGGGEGGLGSGEGWAAPLLGLEGYGEGAAELHGEEREAGAGGSGASDRPCNAATEVPPPRSPSVPSSAAAAAAGGVALQDGTGPDGAGPRDDDGAPLGRSPKRARTDAGAGRAPYDVDTSTAVGTAAAGAASTAAGAEGAGSTQRGGDVPLRSASPAPGAGPGSADGPMGQFAAAGPASAEEAIACGLPGIELAELLGDGPILTDWRRRFPGHRHPGTAPPAPVHDHWLRAAAAAAAAAYMHPAAPYGAAPYGHAMGAGAAPATAAAAGDGGGGASRPRSREESMLEYAEAVLAGLPSDDEAVVLARHAAAAGKTLADVVNFSWGAASGSAPSGSGGGVYSDAVNGAAAAAPPSSANEYGIPTEYVRDPRSGRLTAVGAGAAASTSAAKALYGEYGSWVDPDQIEDYLAKAKRWRREQLPQLWARKKLKEQREAKAKKAARAAAAL